MKDHAAFTLTELAVIIAVIVIFMIISGPFINKIRTKATILACEENLQKIGLGLKLYASENKGKFPPTLASLAEGGYVEDERVFDCPASRHIGDGQEADYHYVTGYAILSPSEAPIVFDKDTNHKDGSHVLCVSGDIIWRSNGGVPK